MMTVSPDVVGLGLCVVDRIVQVTNLPGVEGATLALSEIRAGGGMTANVLVALSRLGVSTGLIAALGDDSIGDAIREELRNEGVDYSRTVTRPDTMSTHIMMLVDPRHHRTGIFFAPQTLLSLQPDELDAAYIQGARVFFTDLEPAGAGIEGSRLAREAGVLVAAELQAGFAHAAALGIGPDEVEAVLQYTDLFLPSQEGLLSFMEEMDVARASAAFRRRYPDIMLAVTMGAQGSIIGQRERVVRIPAYRVEVVDTIGAGDVYHAALIYGLWLQGWDMEQAGHFASAAAALKCTKPGARQGAPTRAQVEALLDSRRATMV